VWVPLLAAAGASSAAVGAVLADVADAPTGIVVLGLAALVGLGTFLYSWLPTTAAGPSGPVPVPVVAEGPVWSLPRRPATFTGRESALAEITRIMGAGQPPVLVALTGIGGVGKTSLALAYAHRVAPRLALVAWIRADERTSVVAALAELGADLGVPGDEPEVMARAALRQLHRRQPWLLVYDDAAVPAVEGLLPTVGEGQVVLTSRREDWSRFGEVLPLRPMPEAEAVALLLRRSGDASADAEVHAVALARSLGHLPLALELAGGYCRRYRVSLAEYRELWRARGLSLMRQTGGRLVGANEVAARLSTDRLAGDDVAAVQLLRLLSMLAPGYQPQDLITSRAWMLPRPLAAVAADPVGWVQLLTRVADAGLIRVEPGQLWTHQLVQQVQRERLAAVAPDKRWRQRLLPVAWRRDPTATWPAARWASLAARLLADARPGRPSSR
jgi:hypothetical protein